MELANDVYRVTADFPREEIYGLTGQMRRAAVSVPSDIAEGAARTTTRDYLHSLAIARGSLSELETQMLLARNLGFVASDSAVFAKIDEVFSLLGAQMNALRARAGS
jgi:four helix bundle protein